MALPVREQSSPLLDEVRRLGIEGFSLIPLGGSDGKQPLVAFRDRRPLPIDLTIGKIEEGAAFGYGIRLPNLTVIDIDSPDFDLVQAMEARFGHSPMKVRTPSGGRHLYYRVRQRITINLRCEGLPIDVKSGVNSYVAGPYSQRPDGRVYTPEGVPVTWSALPEIMIPDEAAGSSRPAPVPRARPSLVPVGSRHGFLLRAGRDLIRQVGSERDLFEALAQIRDQDFADPASFPDAEVAGIANWLWQTRLENRLYVGRDSAFRVQRAALDLLQGNADAIALYTVLSDAHGHRPGKTFALDREAMARASLIKLSRRGFDKARNSLIACGLLEVAQKHKVRERRRRYRLRRTV